MNIEIDKIYLYNTNRTLLSEKDINKIEELISVNKEFSDLVNSVKGIQNEIASFDHSKLDAEKLSSKFRDKNKSLNIFRLKNLYEDETDNVKLAAMQDLKSGNEFTYVNTYASAEKFVMVRILRNPAVKQLRLYIICDDMNLVKNAIVQFDKITEQFVADENGVATINTDFLPSDIDLKIFIPVARFDIDLNNIPDSLTSYVSGKNINAHFSKISNTLKVKFDFTILADKKAFVILDKKNSEFIKLTGDNDDSLTIELKPDISNVKLILTEE